MVPRLTSSFMLDKAELMTSSHALPIKIMLPANFVLRQCIFFKATAQCTMGLYQFSRSNIIVLIVRIQLVPTANRIQDGSIISSI